MGMEKDPLAPGARIPAATYRLQFNAGFPLHRAIGLVSYLEGLGISDIYASPLLAARAGSVHGYDIVDHQRLNPEIGGEKDLDALSGELRKRGMGLLFDTVPNHMCVADPGNLWWADLLENGPSSRYARFFDVDWDPPKIELKNRVLLPFLGDQYGRVLESGAIRVAFRNGGFFAEVYQNRLPIDPRTWRLILAPALEKLRGRFRESHTELLELESILTALEHLPMRTDTDPDSIRERQREKEVVKRRLSTLHEASPDIRRAIDEELGDINGVPGDARSFDRLEELLSLQVYRLCFWRVATDEINYRRFFDINDLAAIRVEDPEVFAEVHAKVLEFIRKGWLTGLRVDHVDGLFDPGQYLRDLQKAAAGAAGRPFYVVVEKILGRDEWLSGVWAAHGTTGYKAMNLLNGIFVDTSSAREMREVYRRITGRSPDVKDLLATCKKLIMLVSMAGELHVLGSGLDRLSEQHRGTRDFTLESLHFALREAIAWFPVYRTYVRGDGKLRDADREHVEQAIREAKRRNRSTSESLFDFIREVWLLEHPEGLDAVQRRERLQWVMRLQQFTGPVMAKGLEDTFFYRHFPLASLNEVGGEPGAYGETVEEFHAENAKRRERRPHSLLATSTHDSKRSEDVRARINVLSEIPDEWRRALSRWRKLTRTRAATGGDERIPDANDEVLAYQSLIGIWPMEGDVPGEDLPGRLEEYMIKAVREAKRHSSWVNPNSVYEEGVREYLRRLLRPGADNRFLPDFAAFMKPLRQAGMMNALAQVVLKTTMPGVPDFYQGTELWSLSLVDPDNRRPVDYEARRSMLEDLVRGDGNREALVRTLLERPEDGRIKLHVTRAALRFRGANRDLFDAGAYLPLPATGGKDRHVCAFARTAAGRTAITACGRFFMALGATGGFAALPGAWGDTRLQLPSGLIGGTWREVLTGREIPGGETLPLSKVFLVLPVAILERAA